MWITEAVADEILQQNGLDLEAIRNQNEALGLDEILDIGLDTVVDMQIEALPQEDVPAHHVIAHLPSYVSSEFGGVDDHMTLRAVLPKLIWLPLELPRPK